MTTTNINNSFIITRFAPSPTGLMHIGNARTALFSYLFAKNKQGVFLLRIEDTDLVRSNNNYVQTIFRDLNDLKVAWDSSNVIYQSQRTEIYEKFYQILATKDLIYPCFCSEESLNIMRKIQLSKGLPPRYNGECLKLTPKEREKKITALHPYCLRFKVPKNITIKFEDLIKGTQTFNSNDFADFIIKRKEGTASFIFCNIIDDILQKITHVLRAEDHVSNTPKQLLIAQALELTSPQYGHFCLLINNNKESTKLSKRTGSDSIHDLLQAGYLPLALLNYLARLGHNYINKENILLSLEELIEQFNIANSTSNAAKHDLTHLKFWQKQAMLALTEQELLLLLQKNNDFIALIKDKKLDLTKTKEFITLIKNNILMPEEVIYWLKILFADTLSELAAATKVDLKEKLKSIDPAFLIITLNSIVNKHGFEYFCDQLKSAGFSNKNLFVNLRLILTGIDSGPELNKIFNIIGFYRLEKRINQIIALQKN